MRLGTWHLSIVADIHQLHERRIPGQGILALLILTPDKLFTFISFDLLLYEIRWKTARAFFEIAG